MRLTKQIKIILLLSLLLILIYYFMFYVRKQTYQQKIKNIQSQINQNKQLSKQDGHVFGLPKQKTPKLDLSSLTDIIDIDYINNTAIVEGNISVSKILNQLMKQNYILTIPIDLYHLTISGLISGVGGGCTSFKHGFFHESVIEFDMILADGTLKTCSKTKNKELFYAIPNSLGTLGYLTKVKLAIQKAKPYVKLVYKRYNSSKQYFKDLISLTKKGNSTEVDYDYLEGTILSPTHLVILIGYNVDNISNPSKIYSKTDIFWKLIQDKNVDTTYFTLYDYMWRWDRDLYYTTMETPSILCNKTLRTMIPKNLMKSTIYRKIAKMIKTEHNALDCNDIFIPFENVELFFDWFVTHYQLYPIYICPSISHENYTLWSSCGVIDFGIGYGVNIKHKQRPKNLLTILENKMLELEGRKLLYTKIKVDENTMWKFFKTNPSKYYQLKKKYDPTNKFLTIYQKSK